MPNIKFSYIFHDCFERILQSFEEVSVSDSFAHPLSKLNFYKGQRFDEDNAEFSFCWKNYYEMKMVVEKVIKRPFIKSYTHRTIYIDKLPINLSFTFNFFWDSINETTILVIDLEYQDDFFTDLIKTDFSSKDKINICKITENNLKKSLKGLENNICCCLNTSIEEARKYLLFPCQFFKIASKDLIIVPKESEVSLDETYELFVKTEKSPNLIPLTVYKVTTLYISSDYFEISFITHKNISFPNNKISFSLRQLENKKCLLMINIKPNEQTSYEMNSNVYKFWKKRILDFSNFFEKNRKK